MLFVLMSMYCPTEFRGVTGGFKQQIYVPSVVMDGQPMTSQVPGFCFTQYH